MLRPSRLLPTDRVVRVPAADFNAALRDPEIRAIAVTGTHRMLDDLDVAAVRADPKPIVGTGATTFIHLELWRRCGLVGQHGDNAGLTSTAPTVIHADAGGLRTPAHFPAHFPGRASGILLGGSLAALRAMVGAGLPALGGAILLLTGERSQGLGQVDRQLTHLRRAGVLALVSAVAVGRFTGFDHLTDRGWTLSDVLEDHLSGLDIPVLGTLPIGPGEATVPIGVPATLDTNEATLTIAPGLI